MKVLFVIPCKEGNYIVDCVSAIRKLHDDCDILVVDSASEDKSYFQAIQDKAEVLDINNVHYMDGAIWTAYKYKKEQYTHFACIQDSVELLVNIYEYCTDTVYAMSWFPGEPCPDRDKGTTAKLKTHTGLTFPPPYGFAGIFGPMMIAPMEAFDKCFALGMSKVLPDNKIENNSMERIWGYVWGVLGYDIMANTVEGRFTGHHTKIKKTYCERL
tara:strand:- start:1698 stop:2339 length:642 start_codon:yes stop_codon:yes gene_type:complete